MVGDLDEEFQPIAFMIKRWSPVVTNTTNETTERELTASREKPRPREQPRAGHRHQHPRSMTEKAGRWNVDMPHSFAIVRHMAFWIVSTSFGPS
jgi:hypothetical protein